VPPDEWKILEKRVEYLAAECGKDPVVNTMTATATHPCWTGVPGVCTDTTTVKFPPKVTAKVECTLVATPTEVCDFSKEVTFTLTATNKSDLIPAEKAAEKLTAVLEEFKSGVWTAVPGKTCDMGCVNPGASGTCTFKLSYAEATYCGHLPIQYRANVHADAEACKTTCICGKLTDDTTCPAEITFAKKVTADVECTLVADPTQNPVCDFSKEVTFTLTACNKSDLIPAEKAAEKLTAVLEEFKNGVWTPVPGKTCDMGCVEPGKCKTCTFKMSYDKATYCGHLPIQYRANVHADADFCKTTCICGKLTDDTTCEAELQFPPWRESNFRCEKKLSQDVYNKDDLPQVVTYVLNACNTGQTALDFTIVDTGLPPGATCIPAPIGGKWVFTDIQPNNCTPDVTCTVEIRPDMIDTCPGEKVWQNTMTTTAALSARQPAGGCGCDKEPDPNSKDCKAKLTVRCSGYVDPCVTLLQVIAGSSNDQ